MIGKRTLFGLLVLIGPLAGPALARDALHRDFAVCTGQLSAQLEHEWLMSIPDTQTERLLRQFQDLLAATAPADAWRETLDLRIRAKVAQHAVLKRATFSSEESGAAWAARRAQSAIRRCRDMLLHG